MMAISGSIPHNHQRDLDAIAHDYKNGLQEYGQKWLAYAIQKDAVQNSWDARLADDGWFLSIKQTWVGANLYLEISDQGTTGLTGSKWTSADEHFRLMENEGSLENLAYFLSSNFSGKGSDSGGKRGRGKSLFLYASNDSCFLFESLRSDGVRIFGRQFLSPDKKIGYDIFDHRQEFETELQGSLPELVVTGTRILIKNPKQELLDSLGQGYIKEYVENTWWEIIKKFKASILIDGEKAQVPDWYLDETKTHEDSKRTRKVVRDATFEVRSGESYRIKRIVFDYLPDDAIPKELKGMAFQRMGMTVQRLATERLVKEEGLQKVYGWVEMDKKLEKDMYDLENVQHLGFDWVSHPAKAFREKITAELREFAKEVKLIESEFSDKNKTNRSIEQDAASKINGYLASLGFKGGGVGRRLRNSRSAVNKLESPLRISLAKFKLPNPSTRRVDGGRSIAAIATLLNESEVDIKLRLKAWITHKEATVMEIGADIELLSGGVTDIGWENLTISKDIFTKGEYTFRTKFIVLEDTGLEFDGEKIEKSYEKKAAVAFSVDMDHKPSGLIKFEAKERDSKLRYVECHSEDQVIVVEYNTLHPYISQIMSRGDRDKSVEPLGNFLLETGIVVAMNQILAEDLAAEDPVIFKGDIAINSNPADAIPILMEKVSQFMWDQ